MGKNEGAAPNAGGDDTRPSLTPLDVQQKEFRVSFRGYNEREVDEFLDTVTVELQRYEAEIMRLRSSPAIFDPAADPDGEADRIIRAARERADGIVREAEARAASITSAGAGDARSVVAPYLNREREFLQKLGSLVQEHAQTIKTMVEEARRRTEEGSTAAAVPLLEDATEAGAEPSASAETDATGAETTPVRRAEAASEDETDVVVLSGDDATDVAEDRDPRREDERQPEGARSLRELFWGED
jgi:cell division initiation protein